MPRQLRAVMRQAEMSAAFDVVGELDDERQAACYSERIYEQRERRH